MEETSTQTETVSSGYGKRPLWQWIGMYVILGLIIYGLIYYFVFAKKGGYNYNQTGQYQQQNVSPSYTMQAVSPTSAMTSQMTVTLAAENNSGESGTAVLKEMNGQVTVTLNVTGFPGNPQPAHIHAGSCPGVGAVKYPLTNVVNAQSVTTLNVTLAQLKQQLPLAINVHQSAANITNYTSCGVLSNQ